MPVVGAMKICAASRGLEHDAEKWKPVFLATKRETRSRGDHAQTTK
jgi:hypothetical protein